MNKMKRISSFLLLLSILLLPACGRPAEKEAEDGFFDNALLAECKLAEMPTPASNEIRHDEGTVYCLLSDEEYDHYLNEVVSFLLEKDDIYFKGYHYETGNYGGMFFLPEYRFAPLAAEADTSCGWFAFSLTEQLNNGEGDNYFYSNGVSVKIEQNEGKIGSYSYNTVIKIDADPIFMTYYEEE
jgi:hypothetical protein